MRVPLLIILLAAAPAIFAQPVQPIISTEADAFYNKAMRSINIKYKSLILSEGKKLSNSEINRDSLVNSIKTSTNWAVLGSMNGQDIEAITFLVLMQAAKSAQEDLKAIMAKVKSINSQKEQVRKQISEKHKQDSLKRLRATGPDSVKPMPRQLSPDMYQRLESLNESSEIEQLKMQTYLDSRQKAITIVSNMFKKIAQSQSEIIANLK